MAPETAITKESSDRLDEIRKTLAYYFWKYPEPFSRYSSVSPKKLYGPWSSIVSNAASAETRSMISSRVGRSDMITSCVCAGLRRLDWRPCGCPIAGM